MKVRSLTIAITAALAVVMAAWAGTARAVVVSLRVESATSPPPLFDGPVETAPHSVDGGDGSGPHACAGPPSSAPAATATGALDDAMRTAGIEWRGNWDPNFRDFFIERIGPYASIAPNDYWSLTINGRFSSGGCLARVVEGDVIRFFYGPLFGPGPSNPGSDTQGSVPENAGPVGKGKGPRRRALRRLAGGAVAFLRQARGVGEEWARLLLALRRGEGADRAAAALLDEGSRSQQPDGSFGGDVNATAIAILALGEKRPQAVARAASWLTAIQSPDGGFGYRRGAAPDVDTTGLATWGLALAGRKEAARKGGAFVRAAQSADGGFPTLPGGVSNAQSTGLGTVALRVAGIGPRAAVGSSTPLGYIASLARRDGSIAYDRHSAPTPVWTTAQAALALITQAKLLGISGTGSR